ncbi:MAG: DUF438 domain-containing protein [Bacteroidales bacterium]|nr:DUF438 domain-containing protein [Bacteroidales bacterium]
MSEFINNSELRIRELYKFIGGITAQKERGTELVQKYREVIDVCHPYDVIIAIDLLMKEQIELPLVKIGVNRSLNMLYKGLNSQPVPDYMQKPFFHYLKMENDEAHKLLSGLKAHIKRINEKEISEKEFNDSLIKINKGINKMNDFMLHYVKLENILFPFIEKHIKESGCLPLMWSYHDDVRNCIKEILSLLEEKTVDLRKFNSFLGDLYFVVYAMRFREEHILFPVIIDLIPENEIIEMSQQAFEVGFSFISPEPDQDDKKSKALSGNNDHKFLSSDDLEDKILDLDTGKLSAKQTIMMLNHLPIDMTFVDENDQVRYFSNPKHRIFQRSKAIIGRLVENCHPPSSVHIVKELVESFRTGKKDKESFWIQMGEKFILIQYFAMHDNTGKYCGTLEVSQEITEIKKLEGEKRLMD